MKARLATRVAFCVLLNSCVQTAFAQPAGTNRAQSTAADSTQAPVYVPIHSPTTVLRRAEIEAAGWNRLAELLEGVPGLSRSSVDGFTYSVAGDRYPAAGLSTAGAPEWLVFVDGVRVPVSRFSQQFMELLPIALAQVDSARFTNGATIINGVPAARGALELFAARHKRGVFGDASYSRGDETGDPGPFRYTNLASPNVEKIGPYTHVNAGYATLRASVEFTHHQATFTSSDTNIVRRLPDASFTARNQYNETRTTSARLRANAMGGEHSLILSHGTQHGLIYVPHNVGEGDLSLSLSTVALTGRVHQRAFQWSYELTGSSMPVTRRSVVLSEIADTRRNSYSARINAEKEIRGAQVEFGAAFANYSLHFPFLNSHTRSQRISGRVGRPVSRRMSAELNVALAHSNRAESPFHPTNSPQRSTEDARTVLDIVAAVKVSYSPHTVLTLSAARLQPLRAADGSWTDRVLLSAIGSFSHLTVYQGAAGLELRSVPFRASASVHASRVSEWELRQLPIATSFDWLPPVRQSASTIGAQLNLESDTTVAFFGRVVAAASTPVSTDTRMRKEVRSTTASEMRAQVSIVPFENFRLSALLHLATGSQWTSLPDSLNSEAPPLRRIDVTLEKWAFKRRVRAQLAFRNLLNTEERYHPLGAQWNLRTVLSLSVATR